MGVIPEGGVMFENVLYRPGGNVLTLLSNKKRPDNTVSNEFQDILKRVIVNKDEADLVPLFRGF